MRRLSEREKCLMLESWKNPEVTIQDLADHLKMGMKSIRSLLSYYGAARRQKLHSIEDREAALAMVSEGISDREVESKLGIKRATVRRWRNEAGIKRKPGRARNYGASSTG